MITGVADDVRVMLRASSASGIAIDPMRDGTIVRAWLQTDRLGCQQQIGAPPNPRTGAPPKGAESRHISVYGEMDQ